MRPRGRADVAIDVPGSNRAAGHEASSGFFACQDIQALVSRNFAAAACPSQGQLWDISNPLAPVVTANIDAPRRGHLAQRAVHPRADVLRFSGRQTASSRKLPMLNPQTQTFLLG